MLADVPAEAPVPDRTAGVEARPERRTRVAGLDPPSTPVSTMELASLRVVALRERDGSPATDLVIALAEVHPGGVLPPSRKGRTLADGSVLFEDLAPGRWEVAPLLGPARIVRVEPGGELEVTLAVPDGVRVIGTVFDRFGSVLARGGRVHVSWPDHPFRTAFAATVDGAGRFVLDEVDLRSWVSVHVQRKGISKPVLVGSWGTPPGQPVELALTARSAPRIEGIVRDPRGARSRRRR